MNANLNRFKSFPRIKPYLRGLYYIFFHFVHLVSLFYNRPVKLFKNGPNVHFWTARYVVFIQKFYCIASEDERLCTEYKTHLDFLILMNVCKNTIKFYS